ncbi:MAG: universal stress protein [Jhaorihella sp.]
MDTILVATDFSNRSDLALARAGLISTRTAARLHLVHVVDDDQKRQIVDGEVDASRQLLTEEAERLMETGVPRCTFDVVLGDPFAGIISAAEGLRPDLVVLGAHRRKLLRGIFVGTTAQRTIRRTKWPILMVNAIPQQDYHNALLASDLSKISRDAAAQLLELGLVDPRSIALLHVFDAPAQNLMMRGTITTLEMNSYLDSLQVEADKALAGFAAALGMDGAERIARHKNAGIFTVILDTAAMILADLVIVASQGKASFQKVFLGSVAEEVLRHADRDVLVIPPRPGN